MASLSNLETPHQDCHRRQRHLPPLLGSSYDGGRVEKWGFGGANAEEQHNGFDPVGIDGDHAEFPHRRLDDEREQRSVVLSIRYYSHASILINVPVKKMANHHRHHHLTAEYVANTVNRGSYFWSLGLRAFYFSFPLFLWIFGPLPMFCCCIALVFMLYFLDVTFQFGCDVGNGRSHDEESGVITTTCAAPQS
ncbi:hypothetical protein V6N13_077194 [Hibiscus sabdariffa]